MEDSAKPAETPPGTDDESFLERTPPGDLAGMLIGLGVRFLLVKTLAPDLPEIARVALAAIWTLGACGVLTSWTNVAPELARCLGVTASGLWSQYTEIQMSLDPGRHYLSDWFVLIAAGHAVLAYATLSPLCLTKAVYLIPIAIALRVAEGDLPYEFFPLLFGSLIALGMAYVLVGRLHRPRRAVLYPSAARFARTYQMAGFTLINWTTCAVSWIGWYGEGYELVGIRLASVTATVVLYSLEIWAGRRVRQKWLISLGLLQFTVQCGLLLGYPHLSVSMRGILVIGLGLLLLAITENESKPKA